MPGNDTWPTLQNCYTWVALQGGDGNLLIELNKLFSVADLYVWQGMGMMLKDTIYMSVSV